MSKSKHHRLPNLMLLALLVSVFAASPALAQAGAPPSPPAADSTISLEPTSHALPLLDRELALHAAEGKRARIAKGITGFVLAAVLLPAGIVLQQREDALIRVTGIGEIVVGATALLDLPAMLFPSDMERIRAAHAERKARGMAADELVRQTEKEWEDRARAETRTRKISGSVHLGLGLALVPVGLTILLRQEVGDLSRSAQVNLGTALLGVGTSFIGFASALLFQKGDAQRAWDEHLITRSRLTGLAATKVDIALIPHGGVLAARASF